MRTIQQMVSLAMGLIVVVPSPPVSLVRVLHMPQRRKSEQVAISGKCEGREKFEDTQRFHVVEKVERKEHISGVEMERR